MTSNSQTKRGPGFYTLLSALMVLPCFWQPRIQAGDLASHIYNAWLAQLVESGRAEGLVVVRQTTNVLFDLLLSGLFRFVGAEAAQRITVSLAVLTFVWGAFAFTCVVSRRRSWYLLPCLAMLAYGWVFHMGFFNFYLSLGLCFWALAALWRPTKRRIAAAVVLLAVGYLGHALPVVWTLGLALYLALARRVQPRRRALLTACCLIVMAGVHRFLSGTFVSRWSPQQVSVSTGIDQLWVFGMKYYIVLIGLLVVWSLLFLNVVHLRGTRRTVLGVPFQLCVLSAAAVIALPNTILLPGFQHALVYIAERMSLGVGVCVCALLAAARPGRMERYALIAVAGIFFSFLYIDEQALNRFEDQMQGIISQLPPGQRVVSAVNDPESRANAVTHIIDRACIGHCFSYANYEASTAQFRLRVTGPNPIVVSSYKDSWALQSGKYVWKESDLPGYVVDLDGGRLTVRAAQAGAPCGTTAVKLLL